MANFALLRAATTVAPERVFTFYGLALPGAPNIELIVRPATEANAAYWNARAKAEAAEPAFRAAQRGEVTVDVPIASRRIDLALFPELVVMGWRHVPDDDGRPVPFSPGVCGEFLAAIQGRFEDLREFCKLERNFTGGAGDVNAVAKHSEPGSNGSYALSATPTQSTLG